MDCVAWDEAKWGRSYEQFDRELSGAIDDKLWFLSQLAKLREKYLNKWIAISNKAIIDSDEDHEALLARLVKNGEDLSIIQTYYVNPENYVEIF